VGASALTADEALGEILTVAGIGEIVGPIIAGAIAQATDLRAGLLTLPALIVIGAAALAVARRSEHRQNNVAVPGRPGNPESPR
jgi:hypothetical protein